MKQHITMVESKVTQRDSGSTMVLPIPPTTGRLGEKTSYQLQPASMLNHSNMLPAAALSNFFRAPASPMNGKLPTIHVSEGKPKISKSIHQRNKCLAEVIQSQLIELKKLQSKHRYQKGDSVVLQSLEITNSRPTKSQHQVEDKPGINFTRKESNASSNSRLLTPDVKTLTSQHYTLPKPTPAEQSNSSAIPLNRMQSNIFLTPSATPLKVPQEEKGKQSPNSNTQTTQLGDTLTNLSLSPVTATLGVSPMVSPHRSGSSSPARIRPPALVQDYMDPVKFATIMNWVDSVEAAHRLEGKWSEVISVPDS